MNSKKLQTKTSSQKWTYEEHEYMVNMWLEKYYPSIRENKKYNVVASDLKHEWELFNKTFKKNRSYNSIYALVSNLKNLTFEEINKENRNEKSKKGFKNSAQQLRSIWNNNDNEEIKKIKNNPNLKETEKIQLIKARLGQGEFRGKIIEEFKCCIFTNIDDTKILIASHIKPWRVSEDNEKLDGNNGLLLSPTYDKLFDLGFISFDENNKLMVSSQLSSDNIKKIFLKEGKIYDFNMTEKRKQYLEYHRNKIFKK